MAFGEQVYIIISGEVGGGWAENSRKATSIATTTFSNPKLRTANNPRALVRRRRRLSSGICAVGRQATKMFFEAGHQAKNKYGCRKKVCPKQTKNVPAGQHE